MDKRQQELGEEQMRQLEKLVCLKIMDTLWQEHLSYMDHVRDSVRLRAYAGRDPLVEYKNEGHKAFSQLQATLESTIAENMLKAEFTATTRHATPINIGADVFGGVGRNDPCPCGSGKKFKKCGELNTEEHQKLISQKQ